MSDTPRTDLQIQVARAQGHEGYVHGAFARVLEFELTDWKARYESLNGVRCNLDIKLTEARNEIAELRQQVTECQANCEHDFVKEDHSFSHEFGTEKIFVCRCSKCGKDAEPGDVPDPGEDGCDDGARDPYCEAER